MSRPAISLVMPYSCQADVNAALRAATFIAAYELGRYRIAPLYRSGVIYHFEPVCDAPEGPARLLPGACERTLSPRQALAEGGRVDCNTVAPWLAAQRILEGARCEAVAIPSPSIGGWHCVVRHANGRIEDPSVVLGMR